MANMTVNQRNQFDRVDLSVPTTGVRVRNRRSLVIYTVIAVAILGALSYATVQAIDGWAKGVVLAVLVMTTIGVMIALNPARRA